MNGKTVPVNILKSPINDNDEIVARIHTEVFHGQVFRKNEDQTVFVINRKQFTIEEIEERIEQKANHKLDEKGPILLISPMSGRIVSLKKQVGDVVKLGESVLVLEAMKMENDIAAAKNGTIKEVYAKQGDLVKTGDKLVRIE